MDLMPKRRRAPDRAPKPVGTVPPGGGKPVGKSVATALDLSGASDAVRTAVHIVDAVHGDGDLPTIPVQMVDDADFAAASVRSEDGTPLRIQVNREGASEAWATVHEIGHFLDQQTLDERGSYASHGTVNCWRSGAKRPMPVRRFSNCSISSRVAL